MKIAIHHRKDSFSERWIKYCEKKTINYKIVNCFDNDINAQLEDCNALMWHYQHDSFSDGLLAKQLLFSIEQSGIKVFPNFNTAWHFDDKLGQKYLFEAFNLPSIPSYVFYDKKNATKAINSFSYPKVFKLRGGAGAGNVKLVLSKKEAEKLVYRAFGKGFSQYDRWSNFFERIRKIREGKNGLLDFFKGTYRLLVPTEFAVKSNREREYIYFQDFIPNNNHDIRLIVIGQKAFGIKRKVRENDFRASGSGNFSYSRHEFDEKTLTLAFETSNRLKCQCCAMDFVYDKKNNPLLIEISYGFSMPAYDKCEGYWDCDLNFFEQKFNPYGWMIEDLIIG